MMVYRAHADPIGAVGGEKQVLSVADFEKLPEEDCKMELIRGWVVREPPAGTEHGWIAVKLAGLLDRYAADNGGAALVEVGFVLSQEPPTVRVPDVSYIAGDRIPPGGLPAGMWPGPPDLAVEVVSPSNSAQDLQEKVSEYLNAGCRMVWVVYPRTRTIAVHRTRAEARMLGMGEELDGGDVLPGLRVPVAQVFGG